MLLGNCLGLGAKVKYLNKNLDYLKLEKIKAKNDEVSLLLIQIKIFEKVKILNEKNLTIKIGQLYSIANDTFDMQFLSFIDALKSKKYNNDSLMYGILLIEGKKL